MSDLEGKKKIAVIGSGTFEDYEMLARILDKNAPKIKLIVSGAIRGADTLATQWATERGVPYLVMPARWKDENGAHDRGAGFRRNRELIAYADVVLAFYDGESRGTKHSIEIAQQLNKPLKVFNFQPKPAAAESVEKAA